MCLEYQTCLPGPVETSSIDKEQNYFNPFNKLELFSIGTTKDKARKCMGLTNLWSIASVMFWESKHLGPPRIQGICPDGPETWNQINSKLSKQEIQKLLALYRRRESEKKKPW